MKEKMVYGINAVNIWLDKKPEQVKWLAVMPSNNPRVQSLVEKAQQLGIAVQSVKKNQPWPEYAQGVSVNVTPHFESWDAWLASDHHHTKQSRLLMLDGVTDPHNLGACLRSADAFGFSGVIVPQHRALSQSPVVDKVSCGASATVPVWSVPNLSKALLALKDKGYWAAGLALSEHAQSLNEVPVDNPLVVVLGAEGTGIRPLVQKHCDFLVEIPMQGAVQSLNVSVTAGICCHYWAKK